MGIDLPLIWALIIGFGLMMYVIMDGFDPRDRHSAPVRAESR